MQDLYEKVEEEKRERQKFEQASHFNYVNKMSDVSFHKWLDFKTTSPSTSSFMATADEQKLTRQATIQDNKDDVNITIFSNYMRPQTATMMERRKSYMHTTDHSEYST